jgi:hypothetical protein
MKRTVLLLLAASSLAACNDPPSTDSRGYTKNTLEQTRLFVRGQAVTEMDRLGDPVMPETARIVLPDSAAR